MKGSDRAVITAVALLGMLIGFYALVISPKRSESADLATQVDALKSSLQADEQLASTAESAKSGFSRSYHRLVVLGKAVPEDSDQASLLVQLNGLAQKAGVSFQSIDLSAGSASAAPVVAPTSPSGVPAPSPGSSPTDTTTSTSTSTGTDSTATASSTPPPASDATTTPAASTAPTATPAVVPTEAAAALQPLGAAVGPAGLPVMPYDLTFSGGFFQIADFLHELDALVHVRHGQVSVNGRLLTVDSFSLVPGADSSGAPGSTSPTTSSAPATKGLQASLSVTTYLTPQDQGLTAGATPSGPVSTDPSAAVPASSAASTPSVAP